MCLEHSIIEKGSEIITRKHMLHKRRHQIISRKSHVNERRMVIIGFANMGSFYSEVPPEMKLFFGRLTALLLQDFFFMNLCLTTSHFSFVCS
jgi:hypothetical protein